MVIHSEVEVVVQLDSKNKSFSQCPRGSKRNGLAVVSFTLGWTLRKATGRTESGRFLNPPDTALNSDFKITESTKNVKKHSSWFMCFFGKSPGCTTPPRCYLSGLGLKRLGGPSFVAETKLIPRLLLHAESVRLAVCAPPEGLQFRGEPGHRKVAQW